MQKTTEVLYILIVLSEYPDKILKIKSKFIFTDQFVRLLFGYIR